MPPSEGLDTLTLPIRDTIFFTARKQEKILPKTVIRDFIKERVGTIESEQNTRVDKREKNEIKEAVIAELLPRAFPRNSEMTAYIDTKNDWLIVNTSSRKKAEELISLLRLDLGDLSVVGIETDHTNILTSWLNDQNSIPDGFYVGEDCSLVASDGESVTYKQTSLFSQEMDEQIIAHLHDGKAVKRLAMGWADCISFLLDDKFSVRRVEFLNFAEESEKDRDIYADLMVMVMTFAQFIPQLFNALGVADARNKI